MYCSGILYIKKHTNKPMIKGMIYTTQDNSYLLGGVRELVKKAKV